MSICALRRFRVHHDCVVGHAWEIEHHLVDLAIAIAAHGNDAVGQRVQHGKHLLRRVIARKVVSRTMIEKVAQKNDGVGRFSLDSRHERAAPVRRAVDIGCNQKLHRGAPFLSLRKHTLSGMQVVARLTPASPISRRQVFGLLGSYRPKSRANPSKTARNTTLTSVNTLRYLIFAPTRPMEIALKVIRLAIEAVSVPSPPRFVPTIRASH